MRGSNVCQKELKGTLVIPAVNIQETSEAVILEAEMPGVKKEDLCVELSGDELTIGGTTSSWCVPQGYAAVHRERDERSYRRTFILGDEVSRERIDALYENGVLKLSIPKSAQAQPKKIEIKG